MTRDVPREMINAAGVSMGIGQRPRPPGEAMSGAVAVEDGTAVGGHLLSAERSYADERLSYRGRDVGSSAQRQVQYRMK